MPRPLRFLARHLRQALRRRDGASTVEFALVVTPFLFVLFAIVEIGLIFVTNIELSNATMVVGRQLRTGAVMASGSRSTTAGSALSVADFRAAICSKMRLMPVGTCSSQLQVDVRNQSSFGSTASNPVSNRNFNSQSLCYNSGSGGSIVEFRAFYLWPINTPLLLNALVNANSYTTGGTTTSGNYYVITSAEAFRVEQNSAGSNGGSGC